VCSGRSAAQAELDALKVKTSKLQEELAALKLAEKVSEHQHYFFLLLILAENLAKTTATVPIGK
jgi:hypothetical protein